MPVFLSHKKEDEDKAMKIFEYFHGRGIKCYIDVLDPTLQTTTDITDSIMKRVKQCTHLMAVVSDNTQKSWWVSFEIGVASELKRRITSFDTGKTVIPEFLEKWPILSTTKHLELFVETYKRDESIRREEPYIFDSVRASISSDAQFHRELKSKISIYR